VVGKGGIIIHKKITKKLVLALRDTESLRPIRVH